MPIRATHPPIRIENTGTVEDLNMGKGTGSPVRPISCGDSIQINLKHSMGVNGHDDFIMGGFVGSGVTPAGVWVESFAGDCRVRRDAIRG